MEKKEKSLFNSVPVEDKAFPLSRQVRQGLGTTHPLKVVGHCSHCQSPIYGPESVSSDEQIVVRRTCLCTTTVETGQKTIQDTMRTK